MFYVHVTIPDSFSQHNFAGILVTTEMMHHILMPSGPGSVLTCHNVGCERQCMWVLKVTLRNASHLVEHHPLQKGLNNVTVS